jgi:hypothetical protein
MVGMVRAMTVAIPPTMKMETRITHMISFSLAYQTIYIVPNVSADFQISHRWPELSGKSSRFF